MINKIYTTLFLLAIVFSSMAQSTAKQFSGVDCNNIPVDLFADLDSGKAVVLHFYMPNCGACIPPAQNIQKMANNVMDTYPGMVKGYAFPYQNSTTCSYSASWVSSGNLSLFAPMDSGAAHVAYYGGFGMPTVVLLGGSNRDVLFVTQSFSTSDTTTMRDLILNMLNPTGITKQSDVVSSVKLYPNPAANTIKLQMNVNKSSAIKIEVVNLLGEVISTVLEDEKVSVGIMSKEIPTSQLDNGIYIARISSGTNVQNYKFTVSH